MRLKKNNLHLESDEQMAYVKWIKVMHPTIIFSSALGGIKTTIGQAVKLKRLGYLKGLPDLMIFYPIGLYHGLFIELKKVGGKPPEPHQIDVGERLSSLGYSVWVCYGCAEAITLTSKYLKGDI